MSTTMTTKTLEETLKALPRLLQEREQALEEKEKEVQRLKALVEAQLPPSLASTSPSDVLRINVGGTSILDVRRRTLTQLEGSLLESLFSGRWDDSLEKDADGLVFIDQPSHLFTPMIDCLRSVLNETPRTLTTQPPNFGDGKQERDFRTMVEYFGMTLGIYRIGIYQVTNESTYGLIGGGGGLTYDINTDEWSTFCLLPLEETHSRDVESFEVTLGVSCSAIQIGWMVWNGNSQTKSYFESEKGRGVGYGQYSISVDCVRRGIAYDGEFTPFDTDKVGTMDSEAVIRAESYGKEWYLNGKLIASETKKSHKSGGSEKPPDDVGILPVLSAANSGDKFSTFGYRIVPCISIKGSCRISTLELKK
jgi:BTB/POZ domain